MADATDSFSYASADDPRLKRFLIRLIERMTGQPRLKRLYDDHRANPVPGESFWDSAIRRLDLKIVTNEDALARLPRAGALVIVANHPFGVLDGVIVCQLIARVRSDFRVLTNAVLNRADEVKQFLLPVDFSETKEALDTNLKSRAAAKQHLLAGGCLIVFPAGGVSTTPKPWDKHAVDAEWKNLTARLIAQAKAPVVPVYFAGQNSRLFQLASHVSMTLRLSLLFKEVHDRIGTEVHVRIGEVIAYTKLATINDRETFMNYLRQATYALGAGMPGHKRRRRLPAGST
ncbi:MAG TPA: lysophospholipid acyltransferase family protein [Rhizomicrobium sp.]|nr:lysophospholipid acyltransferase family protein [Rhizomicrobium sp.]